MQVPFRRVHLTEDAGHVDLYDTSGPQVGTLGVQAYPQSLPAGSGRCQRDVLGVVLCVHNTTIKIVLSCAALGVSLAQRTSLLLSGVGAPLAVLRCDV